MPRNVRGRHPRRNATLGWPAAVTFMGSAERSTQSNFRKIEIFQHFAKLRGFRVV